MVSKDLINALQESKRTIDRFKDLLPRNDQDNNVDEDWTKFEDDFRKIFNEFTKNPLNNEELITSLEKELVFCKESYKNHRATYQRLLGKVAKQTTLKDDLEVKGKEIDRLEHEKKRLEEKLQNEKNIQNKKLEDKNKQINELEDRIKKAAETVNNLNTEKNDLQKLYDDLKNECEARNNTEAMMTNEHDEVALKNVEYTERIKVLSNKIAENNNVITRLDTELQTEKNNLQLLKEQKENFEKMLNKCETENERLKQELQQNQHAHAEEKTQIENAFKDKIAALQRDASQYSEHQRELELCRQNVTNINTALIEIADTIGFQYDASISNIGKTLNFLQVLKDHMQQISNEFQLVSNDLKDFEIKFPNEDYTNRFKQMVKNYLDKSDEALSKLNNFHFDLNGASSQDELELKNQSLLNHRKYIQDVITNEKKMFKVLMTEINQVTEQINGEKKVANKVDKLKHGFEYLNNMIELTKRLHFAHDIFNRQNIIISDEFLQSMMSMATPQTPGHNIDEEFSNYMGNSTVLNYNPLSPIPSIGENEIHVEDESIVMLDSPAYQPHQAASTSSNSNKRKQTDSEFDGAKILAIKEKLNKSHELSTVKRLQGNNQNKPNEKKNRKKDNKDLHDKQKKTLNHKKQIKKIK